MYTSLNLPEKKDAVFYQTYFQTPGVAEARYEHNIRAAVRSALYLLSGDVPATPETTSGEMAGMIPRAGGLLAEIVDPPALPSWTSEADADVYVQQLSRCGFRGGLNWYRNTARNWELLAPFEGSKITVPALFIAGDRDFTLSFEGMGRVIAELPKSVPLLKQTIFLPGCGHWTQQERAKEVNSILLEFLRSF